MKEEVLSKRGLFYMSGRRCRKDFLIVAIGSWLICFVFAVIMLAVEEIWALILVLIIFMAYINLVNYVKRVNDIDKNGIAIVISCFILSIAIAAIAPKTRDLIDGIIGIATISLASIKGTTGDNKYGTDPLE